MKSLPVPVTVVFWAGMGGASVFGAVNQGVTLTNVLVLSPCPVGF